MNYIIGPKRLKRSLYANRTIPTRTEKQVITIVRDELIQLLDENLNKNTFGWRVAQWPFKADTGVVKPADKVVKSY